MRTAITAVGAFLLGIATIALHGDAAQPPGGRRAIRPEKSPNTGLPFSPGILAGNTLYISGHLGRDPVTSRLVTGGINAKRARRSPTFVKSSGRPAWISAT